MKQQSGLTLAQAKRTAQQLADETDQYCLIYKEKAGNTFSVVLEDESWGWQVRASIKCVWPSG